MVVTIIVLLILAGVTIVTLFGENGIIGKAQNAANDTNQKTLEEGKGIENLTDQMLSELSGNNSTLTETVIIKVNEKEYKFKYAKGDTWLELAERLFDEEREKGENLNEKNLDYIKCALFNAIDKSPIVPNIGEAEGVSAPYSSSETPGGITLNGKNVMWADPIENSPYEFIYPISM